MAKNLYLVSATFDSGLYSPDKSFNGLVVAENIEMAKGNFVGQIINENRGRMRLKTIEAKGYTREKIAEDLDLVPREQSVDRKDIAARDACTAELAGTVREFMKFIDDVYAPDLEAKAHSALATYRQLAD